MLANLLGLATVEPDGTRLRFKRNQHFEDLDLTRESQFSGATVTSNHLTC